MTVRNHWFIVTLLLAASFVLSEVPPAGATFTNVTTTAGITHSYDPKTTFETITMHELEFLSGGAAAGDYDNDGWVDLYVTRYYAPDVLYHNNGNGTFSEATSAAFGALPTRNTNGAAWGDVDNDGDSDLYVASIGQLQHFLYINDGAGHFTEEAVARGAAVSDGVRITAGTSTSFGDYDNDGWLDMYVGEWRLNTSDSIPVQARLLRNLGAANPGHFEDTTDSAGVNMDLTSGPQAGKSFSFTPRFVDFDRDGHQDVAVASDYDTSRVFWNDGDGTFTDGTTALTALGLDFGRTDMGFTIGDLNGDGRLDWFNTDNYSQSIPGHDGNRLFINNGDRTFTDNTTAAGVRNAGWGWGTDSFDYDNDGDLDLIATNGYHSFTDRNRFFENNYNNTGVGVFTERAIVLGITEMLNGPSDFDNVDQGRGLLTFDFDKDGDLDVFIVNNHQAPLLYRNDGSSNNWLNIDLEGTISNRDGIGAVITVTPDTSLPNNKIVTEVDGSSNYLAQSQMTAHFGLGALSGTIDLIQIEWPASGIVQQFTDVAPNQLLTIVERVGDYNGDGRVDAADYTVWRNNLGTNVAAGTGADGNRDSTIDGDDYSLWRKTYGMVVFQAGGGSGLKVATVPEPAAGALLGLAIPLFGARWKSLRCQRRWPRRRR